MNREAMKHQIMEALSKKLGDGFHLSIQKVLKTNVKLDGLTIIEKETNISPVIYLEPFYEYLEKGMPIDKVADMILHNLQLSKYISDQFALPQLLDFEQVKSRFYVELVNKHLNEELLRDIPHSFFLDDFAITIRCILSASEEGFSNYLVHNTHMLLWKTDFETLITHALHNTREMFGVELEQMEDYLRKSMPDMPEGTIPKTSLWVMTNKWELSGASTALFDDVLRGFAEEHGNFYVIFSSVDEVLLMLTPDNSDIDEVTQINLDVNAKNIAKNKILGTKAYYYSKDKGFVL